MPSKRIRKRKKTEEAKLNITSMMDMFTIILVFLLKSYSAEGQLVTPAAGLEIPSSKTEIPASRPPVEVKVSAREIAVGNQVVADVPEVLAAKDMSIKNLVAVLKKEKENAELLAESLGEEFKGELVIQGDKKMPYKLLTRVMYSCGQAGYSKQNFVVYKDE
ncbi:MAG: biopolymer transporter ExbD [Fibrobacteria bacterium]|nr:biopolymer transporter ExbD [Fibrobacteria bacterium]